MIDRLGIRVVGELQADRRVDQVQISLRRTHRRDHVAEDQQTVDHRRVLHDVTADRFVDQLDGFLKLALNDQQQHVVEHVAVKLLHVISPNRLHFQVERSTFRQFLQQTILPVLTVHSNTSTLFLCALREATGDTSIVA